MTGNVILAAADQSMSQTFTEFLSNSTGSDQFGNLQQFVFNNNIYNPTQSNPSNKKLG